MSDTLKLLFTKERQWAIPSHHSLQKSDCEQLAQVALYKRAMWVIRSWLRKSLLKNEQITQKIHIFCMFFCQFFPLFPKSKLYPSLFAHSLFFKEQLERFAPVAHYKRTTLRDSLLLLFTSDCEQFAQVGNRSEEWEGFALFHKRITLSLSKNWWANCTDEISIFRCV